MPVITVVLNSPTNPGRLQCRRPFSYGGNILSKRKYAYTTDVPGEALETIPYVYGNANWKDKLTSYNGATITYDAIGNRWMTGADLCMEWLHRMCMLGRKRNDFQEK